MRVFVNLVEEIFFIRIACVRYIRDHQAEGGASDGTLPVHTYDVQV